MRLLAAFLVGSAVAALVCAVQVELGLTGGWLPTRLSMAAGLLAGASKFLRR